MTILSNIEEFAANQAEPTDPVIDAIARILGWLELVPQPPMRDFIEFPSEAVETLRRHVAISRGEDPTLDPDSPPYFGGCPECGETDGYVNVRSCHWFVCDEHRTKWCAGSNLFSSWHDEAQKLWETNAEKLDNYRTVVPIYQPEPLEDDEAIAETYPEGCFEF